MFGTSSTQTLVSSLSPQDRAELRRLWFEAPPVWSLTQGECDPADTDDWLGSLRPDDWHEIALRFDWDTGDLAPIVWIAARPDADRATILTILLEQDVRLFEDMRRLRPDEDPRRVNPDAALLIDLIAEGFAAGHYPQARFGLSHDAGVLPDTRSYLSELTHPLWSFPDRAWAPCAGALHRPDFLWDHAAGCQRLRFEDWLLVRLRPH